MGNASALSAIERWMKVKYGCPAEVKEGKFVEGEDVYSSVAVTLASAATPITM